MRSTARAAQIEAERAKANSFRSCVEGYLADPGRRGGARMKSHTLVKQRLENHAMSRFGDRPISEIARSEIKDLLRDLVKAGKPTAANRLLGNLKLVFKWAVEADKIESSPIVDLERPVDESSRDRVLTDAELAEIWRGCDGLSKAHAGAVRLMMLTGARRGEAGGLRCSEMADGVWNLPAERSKNGRPHIVPLADLAHEVIAGVPRVDGGDRVFSLDGVNAVSGWSKVKARLDKVIGEARAQAAGEPYKAAQHDLPRWTFHDLRRTMVTGMIEHLGIAPHVVEAVVNHVSGQSRAGVAGVYNRSVMLPQRRAALEGWARHVTAIATGQEQTTDNVLSLRAGAMP